MEAKSKVACVVLCGRNPISEHGQGVINRAHAAGFNPVRKYSPPDGEPQIQSWINALGLCIAEEPDAVAYAVFEDDVQIAVGLADYLDAIVSTDWGKGSAILSAYCPGIYLRHPAYKQPDGLVGTPWRMLSPSSYLIGACCLVFPAVAADMLILDADNLHAAIRDVVSIENYLADWARRSGRPIFYHNPSLIRHLGAKPGDQNTDLRRESIFLDVCPTIKPIVKTVPASCPGCLMAIYDQAAIDGWCIDCNPANKKPKASEPLGRSDRIKRAMASPVEMGDVKPSTADWMIRGPRRPRPRVSIIIAGRNSAEWIKSAILSATSQTVPCEVIVADDFSTDETRAMLSTLDAKFVQSYGPIHSGVVGARNRGASIARGDYLCFLDADDMMPADYIERHLAAIAGHPGCPFVYGSALAFGKGPNVGKHWMPTEFDHWDKWGFNTVNTSALYARWAFEAAGRWQEVPTMWDFDLALRACRVGGEPPRTSKAVLQYRQHESSWSRSVDLVNGDLERGRYAEFIHRRNARLAVATILSGRTSGRQIDEWADRLACSVRHAGLNQKPILIVAVDPKCKQGRVAQLNVSLSRYDVFSAVRFETLPFGVESHNDEESRRHAVSRYLARANQWVKDTAAVSADALWIVEDDIFVPVIACRELWHSLTSGMVCAAAVTAVYRNRHNTKLIVGGVTTDLFGKNGFNEFTEPPKDRLTRIDVAGCGCLMTWIDRPMIPPQWPSHVNGTPAHDWAYCLEIRRANGAVLMDSLVQCGHVIGDESVIWPADPF